MAMKKSKVLVYDLGITTKKKRNYKNKNFSMHDGIVAEASFKGIKIYSNVPREGFYYINKKLNKDLNFEFSFTWVDGNNITPIIQIRETENMDILTTFQRLQDNCWEIYTNAKLDNGGSIVDFEGHKHFKKSQISPNDEVKLVKKGKNIKVYCANKLVINQKFSFNSDFYIGFGGHEMGNRYTIFKELILKRLD